MQSQRFSADDLIQAIARLFQEAGASTEVAQAIADILVEADMLGYSTHGLQFVPAYLTALETGATKGAGMPEVVSDNGASLVLDGGGLAGQWVMLCALKMAVGRTKESPITGIAIRNVANISCLATYARRAAMQGYFAVVAASAPTNSVVAPFGGATPVLSTNPFAIGIPGGDHPILIDTSAAAVTNRGIERAERLGQHLAFPALVTPDGKASANPAAFRADPPAAIQPAGGDYGGHKGFALGILVEALTSGLAGAGRSSEPKPPGNAVYLQLIDPASFGGGAHLASEMDTLAGLCRAAVPRDLNNPVRMPGDKAARIFDEQSEKGVELSEDIFGLIMPCLKKYGIAVPEPIA